MTVTEQRSEQPIRSAHAQSGTHATPMSRQMTRRVRPSVLYLLGRPAQSWVDALNRGTVTIAR